MRKGKLRFSHPIDRAKEKMDVAGKNQQSRNRKGRHPSEPWAFPNQPCVREEIAAYTASDKVAKNRKAVIRPAACRWLQSDPVEQFIERLFTALNR